MRVFYLNNPASGHRNGRKYFPLITDSLRKNRIDFVSGQTEYAGHGTALIGALDFSSYDAIVVSGGDGSLFEAVNGYFANKSNKRIPIAIVPIGRGNAFARDLDLVPERWEEAIKAVAVGETRMVDVGRFTTQGKQYYFVNIVGFGFVTDTAATALKLNMLGDLSYLVGVLHQTIRLNPYRLTIEYDGVRIERENVFVEISNSRYTGKDFLMAPDARIDDGLLDVTLLNKLTRRRVLQCLPKIFSGTHGTMAEVETFRARHLKIETSPAKMLTPDGQLMGSTPIDVECLPSALEVIVP